MPDASTSSAAAREQLILEHVPLVKHLVGRLGFDAPGLDRDDLCGVGMIGLVAAADAWDEERGVAFSTFAYTRIRGAILDELRRLDVLPRGRRERVRELDKLVQHLAHEQGVPPTPEQIAAAAGITLDELDEALCDAAFAQGTSLDEGEEGGLGALLTDPRSSDPVGSLEWQELCSLVTEEIMNLSEQEKTVITLHYAEELMGREIATVLGVTESRVSQIHTRALYRLNRALVARTGQEDPR